MNRLLLTAFLGLALLVGACDKQSSVNSPSTSPTSAPMEKLLSTVDLSTDQITVVDEMFYAGEDLGLILPAAQVEAINGVTGPGTDVFGDPATIDRRLVIDMDALLYLDLIIKANPGIDPKIIAEIKRLIAQNHDMRINAIKNAKDRASLAAALEELHNKLMRQITALLSKEQIANVEALKARLEKQRAEIRAKLEEMRINAQVGLMTKVLGLSERQAAEVKKLLMQQLADIDALRLKFKDNPEGLRLAIARLQAQYDEMLHKLLGDVLWRKWIIFRSAGRLTPAGN